VERAKKYDNFFFGKWLPRIERTLSNGERVHVYWANATKEAERERSQAIAIDAGLSLGDPAEFPLRNGKELDQVNIAYLPKRNSSAVGM
jgi:hypothetical protein